MIDLKIQQGDALDLMATLPDGSVNCVITDPAYDSQDKWRAIGTTTRLGGGRSGDKDPDRFFPTVDFLYLIECIREFDRLLPKNGHAWLMVDGDILPKVLNYVRETNETAFSPCRKGYSKSYPVIKRAAGGGYRSGLGWHLRGSHEYAVLLEKRRRRFPKALEAMPDVFELVWSGDAETRPYTPHGKPFPTAKPVVLYQAFMSLSSAEGETVLDPFAESGSMGVAARQLGRKALLFDKDSRAISTMQARLVETLVQRFQDGPLTDTQLGLFLTAAA